MESLTIKRGVIKGKLTRFKKHFDKIDPNQLDDNIISELNLRLQKVEPCWDDFNEIQGQIETSDVSQAEGEERDEFEDIYYKLIGQAKALINKYESSMLVEVQSIKSDPGCCSVKSAGSQNNQNNFTNVNSMVKLPTIKLPSFNGEYGNWLEYRDAFKALVDNNEGLSDIQKFYYLRSSLEKDASQVIKSMEVSAENYKAAWQLLVERYENKPLMIHNHIKAIFEYPSLNKESHGELRNLYDGVTKHLRALKTLGEETDSWDRLIIYIITSKFDLVTRRDWESYKYKDGLPDMADMNSFLKSKCEVLEKLEISKNDKLKRSKLW